MGILGYLLALGITTLVGVLVLRLFRLKESFFFKIEFFLYSFLLGAILLPLTIFLVAWAGMALSFLNLALLSGVVLAALFGANFFFGEKVKFQNGNFLKNFLELKNWKKILIGLGALWIGSKIFFGALSIATVPTYQDDTFGSWNKRGKLFFHEQHLILEDKESKNFFGAGYKNHPIPAFLFKTYLMKFYGKRDSGFEQEGLVNSVSFYFFLISIFLIFFAVFRETGRFDLAFLSSYLLTSIPLYQVHGATPYFDLYTGLYFFVAAYLLHSFLNGKISNLLLPALFIGLLGYTKSEGLIILTTAIFGAYFFVLLGKFLSKELKKKEILDFSKILGFTVAFNGIFLIFKAIYGLGFSHGNRSVGESMGNFKMHTEIFDPLWQILFYEGNYNLLFLFFVICIPLIFIFLKDLKKEISIFLYSILIGLFGIFCVYFFTDTSHHLLTQIAFNRSLLQFFMIFVFVLVLFSFRILKK